MREGGRCGREGVWEGWREGGMDGWREGGEEGREGGSEGGAEGGRVEGERERGRIWTEGRRKGVSE